MFPFAPAGLRPRTCVAAPARGTLELEVMYGNVCHRCSVITLHPTEEERRKARTPHAEGKCNFARTKAADHSRYTEEVARDTAARELASAVREYLTPECFALASNERYVVCRTCKIRATVDVAHHAAALEHHKHAAGDQQPAPPEIARAPCSKIWLQARENWTDRVSFTISCGYCKNTATYNRHDATAALAHHYGQYCTRPSHFREAPTPTSEDAMPARAAKEWKAAMDDVRQEAETAIRTSTPDPLDSMDSMETPIQTTPKKRPREDETTPAAPTKTPRANSVTPNHSGDEDDDDDEPRSSSWPYADSQDIPVSVPQTIQDTRTHRGKPPPIVVDSEWRDDFFDKIDRYNTGLQKPFSAKLIGGAAEPKLLLRTHSMEDYRHLLATLRAAKEPFTTRTPPEERQERLVACRVPTGIPADSIAEALTKLGLPVLLARRVTVPDWRGSGRALDKVLCVFPTGTAIKEVAERAGTLFSCRIHWERYDNGGEPVQCYKCQDFNHGNGNCGRVLACRKCSREHLSRDCPGTEVRCANCGKAHRSTYKGCKHYIYYKDLAVQAKSKSKAKPGAEGRRSGPSKPERPPMRPDGRLHRPHVQSIQPSQTEQPAQPPRLVRPNSGKPAASAKNNTAPTVTMDPPPPPPPPPEPHRPARALPRAAQQKKQPAKGWFQTPEGKQQARAALQGSIPPTPQPQRPPAPPLTKDHFPSLPPTKPATPPHQLMAASLGHPPLHNKDTVQPVLRDLMTLIEGTQLKVKDLSACEILKACWDYIAEAKNATPNGKVLAALKFSHTVLQ